MSSGYGYVVDEAESAGRIFSAVVTGGTYNAESPLRGGWS